MVQTNYRVKLVRAQDSDLCGVLEGASVAFLAFEGTERVGQIGATLAFGAGVAALMGIDYYGEDKNGAVAMWLKMRDYLRSEGVATVYAPIYEENQHLINAMLAIGFELDRVVINMRCNIGK